MPVPILPRLLAPIAAGALGSLVRAGLVVAIVGLLSYVLLDINIVSLAVDLVSHLIQQVVDAIASAVVDQIKDSLPSLS